MERWDIQQKAFRRRLVWPRAAARRRHPSLHADGEEISSAFGSPASELRPNCTPRRRGATSSGHRASRVRDTTRLLRAVRALIDHLAARFAKTCRRWMSRADALRASARLGDEAPDTGARGWRLERDGLEPSYLTARSAGCANQRHAGVVRKSSSRFRSFSSHIRNRLELPESSNGFARQAHASGVRHAREVEVRLAALAAVKRAGVHSIEFELYGRQKHQLRCSCQHTPRQALLYQLSWRSVT